MPLLILAAIWGFAEATFFFFIPDVLLTHIGLWHGAKKACIAACVAVLGAVVGGMLMFLWGARDEGAALAFLDLIPAIAPDMFVTVQGQLRDYGVMGLFHGTANGIPYKIYAVQAPAQGISFISFALLSFPARLYRMLISALLAAGIGYLTRKLSNTVRYGVFATFWIVSYAIYFYNFL
ncbi:MAG: hypothetical protein ACR2QR_00370 [Woeseiaceae bacterium]